MMKRLLGEIGENLIFLKNIFSVALSAKRPKNSSKLIFEQISVIYFRTLGTVALAGSFGGALLVIQFHSMLAPYQANVLLGGLETSSLIREIGPLIISFLLAGKIGAYTTAELGTMRVTEQIDAMQTLGRDPLALVIVPRFVAIVVSGVVLLLIGLAVGVCASIVVSQFLFGLNWQEFASQIPKFVSLGTFAVGISRSVTYCTIVGLVACRQGYFAQGGAQGVGRAVTRAAIQINFAIVFADFCISRITQMVEVLWH